MLAKLLLLLLFSTLGLCRFSDVSGHNYNTLKVGDSARYRRDQPVPTKPPTINVENHIYYESNFYNNTGDTFNNTWYDLSAENTTVHPELSAGYYLYDPVDLKFRFPFYGHYLNSIAITTHGFLSTADILHTSIYLTQYIAPYSADFNPSLKLSSKIHYISKPDVFIVQWSNVHLETDQGAGGFTFQVQLRPSGEITFVYKTVPLTILEASKKSYESFYGLADGFILNIDGTLYLYSYHNLTLPVDRNLTRSVYVLTPLENCITAGDKQSCNGTSCTTTFECAWCDKLQICSDGLDRRRQDWYNADCHEDATVYCSSQVVEQTSSTAAIVVVVVLLVLFLVLTLVTVPIVILIVWGVNRYRKGGTFWSPSNQVSSQELVSEKSDQVILREAEDAI